MKIFKDKDRVRTIGHKYLQQHPEKGSRLRKLLSLVDDMESQVVVEFMASDCVTIDGWILARSEARECALYYLEKPCHAY